MTSVVVIIPATPLILILLSLYDISLKIERDYLLGDSIFFYKYIFKFSNNFSYFSFANDICISFISPLENKESVDFSEGFVIINKSDEIKYSGKVKFKNNSVIPIETFKMAYKFKWNDKLGLGHSLRVYSNGSIIHSTKLFKYMYKLGLNGFLSRKRI
jgi:hypothetical protein